LTNLGFGNCAIVSAFCSYTNVTTNIPVDIKGFNLISANGHRSRTFAAVQQETVFTAQHRAFTVEERYIRLQVSLRT
jgi:hypothetical protein